MDSDRSSERLLQELFTRFPRPQQSASLLNDIWMDEIFPHLSIRDIIRVRQVSKLFYELTHTTILWKNILRSIHFTLPPLPPTERYSFDSLSSFETERLIICGLHLDANWRSIDPELARNEIPQVNMGHDILSMKIVPGGHHMVASVRDFGEKRYSLMVVIMDHRRFLPISSVRIATPSKADHIQAKYMDYRGEMGIMIAYVTREPARKVDRMADVDISESLDGNFPVPVQYEVVVRHITLELLSSLENTACAYEVPEDKERGQMLENPLRYVTSLKTTVPIECLDLAEMDGDPYVFAGKRSQRIVLENLTTGVVSRVRMPPLITLSPPFSAVYTLRAMRALGNQHQLLIARTCMAHIPPAEQTLVELEEPYKQQFALEIYNLPEEGQSTAEAPECQHELFSKAFNNVCISDYVSPSTYYHQSLPRNLSQNIEMPTISVFLTFEDPLEMMHMQLKARRIALQPQPASTTSPVDENDEPTEDAASPLPSPPPPVEETIFRYNLDIDADNITEKIVEISTFEHEDPIYHIIPGGRRTLLICMEARDGAAHPVPKDFLSYVNVDPPSEQDKAADELWPYDKEQHDAAASERAWIDMAYGERSRRRPICSLYPSLVDLFEDGLVTAAWDEWSGRLCLVFEKDPQTVRVADYAWAPREDANGNRLPLPVPDVDVWFRQPRQPEVGELKGLVAPHYQGVKGLPSSTSRTVLSSDVVDDTKLLATLIRRLDHAKRLRPSCECLASPLRDQHYNAFLSGAVPIREEGHEQDPPIELMAPKHSSGCVPQRFFARFRRQELYTQLPNDIWVDEIFPHLSIRDIIRVRQVSKLLYELTHTPILWKNILRTVHFPLPPLPPIERYSFGSLSSFETERLIVRGLTLDANWQSLTPAMDRQEYVSVDAYHEVLSMKMVPGGHHMLASVRDFAENRYALVLFMMEHRVYGEYPIAKTPTESKAYHIQAKYMVYEGEMGVMVAYVRREPARKADRMANVNVSEFSEDHYIDFPVPVRYEVVIEHISMKSIATLEDPVHPPGTHEYKEHASTLEPPFRHVTSLKTNTSVDYLELAEIGGDPYVFLGKRSHEVVQKNLATGLISRITMPALITVAPPTRAITKFRAMRVLGNQRQLIVVRTTTVVYPTPAELYLASLEEFVDEDEDDLDQGDPMGQDPPDEEEVQDILIEEDTVEEEGPAKQRITLEIFDLPDDGKDSADFPRFYEPSIRSMFSSISISEYIPPSTYFHPSLLRKLDQNIEMPPISIFAVTENPWEILQIQLKARRMPLHPQPDSPPVDEDEDEGGTAEDATPPPPPPPPPAEETYFRYNMGHNPGDFTETVFRFLAPQEQKLHVFPGARRSLLIAPTAEDVAADERWPYDRAQHEAAAADRAWIHTAYKQRALEYPIHPLNPPLAPMFGEGLVTAAWDEWSGRLCLVSAKAPRTIDVLNYAWAPREDMDGNRLPLPVHDVDVRFRRPVSPAPMDTGE
ncbi:hypothetical protein EVG20_g3436 [Dentipellis fragilis]|uniref:F-box domain-containing protein n=1 Tax=Dentipellis fragilis TaxID=205917 RepID=A0A4Y9Z4F2_9AGAM|nr:hypothetical protein EVG20_g3436 [Dentipellis fragilis]